MNIRSLFKAFSAEKSAVQNEELKKAATPAVSSKGIASVTDSFVTSKNNFFSGKKLDADSLQNEQDYSREIFDPHKRYSGVKMQQGRVQLDSDTNESDNVNHDKEKVLLRDSAFTSFKGDDD
ncbi:MAG TPA: hypothetical protein VH815_08520 [Acidobacteriota bacterium]